MRIGGFEEVEMPGEQNIIFFDEHEFLRLS